MKNSPPARRLVGHREAYAYLIRSVRQYPNPERIAEIMHEAGLSRVRWFGLSGGIVTIHVGVRTDRGSNANPERTRVGSEGQDRGAASPKARES